MKKYSWIASIILFCNIFIVLNLISCTKPALEYKTTSDVNIVDYLRGYPNKFSEFVKILDRTNVTPFLNAYGAYTCFAPTNEAFKLYLKKIGKTSTDQLDTATLKNIIKLHLIADTITTGSFTDGKLPSPTMFGQYLITGVNDYGATLINRQAILIQPYNILTGNGYIHVIDSVLQPATQTIAQMLESNENYKIFTQLLKATGFYDTLNIVNNPDTTRKFLTCLAEPDSILAKQNIFSYSDMITRFGTSNPKNKSDSLYLYAAYHILPSLKYVADIVSAQSHLTLAPQSVLTVSLTGQNVLLNEIVFNGSFETGVPINRLKSDNTCSNGVLNVLSNQLLLKTRKPYRVDFDPADQPEIRKLTSTYRRAGKSQQFAYGTLQDVNWQQTKATVTYFTEAATSTNYYWWDDGFAFNSRTNFNNWIEFKTPLIVKGKYKFWCNFRRSSMGQFTQVTVDGDTLTDRYLDFATSRPRGIPTVLESLNYKVYTTNQSQTNNYGMCLGVVDIKTTDRHTLRLTCARDQGSGSANTVTMDFFQFIPVNDDQLRPLFGRDGAIVP